MALSRVSVQPLLRGLSLRLAEDGDLGLRGERYVNLHATALAGGISESLPHR